MQKGIMHSVQVCLCIYLINSVYFYALSFSVSNACRFLYYQCMTALTKLLGGELHVLAVIGKQCLFALNNAEEAVEIVGMREIMNLLFPSFSWQSLPIICRAFSTQAQILKKISSA